MKSDSNRRDFIRLGATAGVLSGATAGVFGQNRQRADQEETEVKNDLLLKDFEPTSAW